MILTDAIDKILKDLDKLKDTTGILTEEQKKEIELEE